MKLIIEVRRGTDEHWRDVRELRHEVEMGLDAGADVYVQALAAFMFARTFCPETIVDAFRDYVDEWDVAHEDLKEEWNDFYENTDGEKISVDVATAIADSDWRSQNEKTAPVQDGEGGY